MAAIVLVDCNNFFVSCEELFDPSLKGRPVCVLGNNDGCVIARSNPAKDLGVAMGMPYFIAKKKFKDVIYLSGNHSKYREISRKIMQKLYDFSPTVEKYSIDEAFIDITGCERAHKASYFEIAQKIRFSIKDEIGIDVSIGLSSSKTLAKLASEIAKSNLRKKTDISGVFEINVQNMGEILRTTSINEIWGIGRNLDKTLRRHNIRSALDFINLPEDFLKRNLGKNGLDMQKELSGVSINPVSAEEEAPKSISKTASFRHFVDDKSVIKNALNHHCHLVCTQLRSQNLTAKLLVVMLRTKDFKVYTNKLALDTPIESEFEINKEIYRLFDEIYLKGVMYRSSGVILSRIEKKKEEQLGLFNAEKKIKSKNLSKAWDNIEKKYGFGSLKIGADKARNDE
ncbi:MAG: Y-family DNA polymerase [Candidatus Gastranaerophilales bacterium]|nr:Y-family DNA polymerase [Candidatus Gastranaerophilales bacterium]